MSTEKQIIKEEKTENSRMLIFENVPMLNAIIGDLSKYEAKFNLLNKAYENLEMGGFANEVFADLKSKGTKNVIALYVQSVENELQSAGIKNKTIIKATLEDAEQPKQEFINAWDAVKSVMIEVPQYGLQRTKTLALEDIVFSDGTFKVADKEAIAESYCRVYLSDDIDREIFASLLRMRIALNDFYSMTKKYGVPFGLAGSGLETFFKEQEDEIAIKPYSVEHAKTLLPRMKAYHDREQNRLKRQEEIKEKARIELEEKQRMFREDPANKYYYETENLEH